MPKINTDKHKKVRSYRLTEDVVSKLKLLANRHQLTQGEFLSRLIQDTYGNHITDRSS